MLDVHPPHHPVHAWRDLFIHIATIVIGLLIAIGLEQTVEHIHEHHQVTEAHAMLRAELDGNRLNLVEDSKQVDMHLAHLWEDLAVVARIRAHQARPGDQVVFVRPSRPLQNSAWQTVHASNVSEHMDPNELADYGHLYQMQQTINDMSTTAGEQLQESLSPLVGSEDPRVETTAQIAQIEGNINSAKDMETANRQLSHVNHPERLTPAQLDAVEQGLQKGIIEDRLLQRFLAALDLNYTQFEKGQPVR
jgi:hypothetical protein